MSQAGQNVDASGLSRWDGQPLTLEGLLQAERSYSGTAVMNDDEGHQRSFSVRPSERPLHLQDRVLASEWRQALS